MKVRYADNFISATVADIESPYTTVSLGTGESGRLVDHITQSDVGVPNEGEFCVPFSLLDASGDPITDGNGLAYQGYITGWNGTDDDITVEWSYSPSATVSSGAQIAVRLTARAMDMQPAPFIHSEGDKATSDTIYIAPGSYSYASIGANSVTVTVQGYLLGFDSFSVTSAPAVVIIDNSGAYTGATIVPGIGSGMFGGTLVWADDTPPAFTSGSELIKLEIRWYTSSDAIGEWSVFNP